MTDQTKRTNSTEENGQGAPSRPWINGCLALALAPWVLGGMYLIGSLTGGIWGAGSAMVLGALFLFGVWGGRPFS